MFTLPTIQRSLGGLLAATLLLGLAFAASPAAAEQREDAHDPPLRTMVLLQSVGFEHPVTRRENGQPSVVEQVLTDLAQETGDLEPEFTYDVTDLTSERLEETDLVIFYTTGDLPFEEGQFDAFENWIASGGLFMGLHSATDTLHDHPVYPRIVGGTFNGHPWNANDTVTIKVQDDDHPATQPYIPEATFEEEIYQFRNFDPEQVRVLISLDMQQTEKKRPYHVPIAWGQTWGDGHAFYTSLGHNEHVWRSDEYQQHLHGAIQWLAGWEPGSAQPNPELHERENRIAEQAVEDAAE